MTFYSFHNVQAVATLHLPNSQRWVSWLLCLLECDTTTPQLTVTLGANSWQFIWLASRTCLESLGILNVYPYPAWAQFFSFPLGSMRFNLRRTSIVDIITLFVFDFVLPPFPAPLQGLAFSIERISITLSLSLTSLGVVLFIIDTLSSPLDSGYSACTICSIFMIAPLLRLLICA